MDQKSWIKEIDWAIPGEGGRQIEIPLIQKEMSRIHNKKIADFGCMDGNKNSSLNTFSTSNYGIPDDNEIIKFDIIDVPSLIGQYIKCDLMNPGFFPQNSFDIGICVSVVEHIGLKAYHNQNNKDGDLIALQNMVDVIRPHGLLYITVPTSINFHIISGWIRSYSPQQIFSWKNLLKVSRITARFFINTDKWYECSQDNMLIENHYTPGRDINAVVCAIIEK